MTLFWDSERGEAMKKLGQAPRYYAKSLQNTDIRSEPVLFHSLGVCPMFRSQAQTTRPRDKLGAGGEEGAGLHTGVEAAVGLATARRFNPLRVASDIVKQSPKVMHQLAPCFG